LSKYKKGNILSGEDKIKTKLKSKDPNKQEIALYVLIHEGEKTKYLNEIIQCTNSPNSKVRLAAFMVLDKIRNKLLIPYFEKGIEDDSIKIRLHAALSLAKYKNKKGIPILMEVIKNDIKDHSIHKRAIEALGKYKDKKLIGIFKELLNHRRIVSRIKALIALSQIRNEEALNVLKEAEKKETNMNVKLRIRSLILNKERQ
jgi:HEAT repeat protein